MHRATAVVIAVGLGMALGACGGGGTPSGATPATSPTPSTPASGTTATTLPIFNQAVLHDTTLTLDPADWRALRDNFRGNQYYSANITLDGETLRQVGIRSRGDGSRDETKPGLKVDFNKYSSAQEYHGYKTLVLDNMTQDSSMLRERLAFAVFEAMGIPAPRNAFTRLTVNGEYWGVYDIVESVSKPFLEARLGEKSGTLFDYEYAYPYDFAFRGGDPGAYVPSPFQPQTNEDKPDVGVGLVAFVEAINRTSDQAFVATISNYLDTDKFLTYLATENAMAESDGFVGELGANNFFLYQYGGQNRWVFIPWDKDSTFQRPAWPIFYHLDTNVLTRRLTDDAAKRKVYVDAVQRAVSTYVNSRWLTPILESAYSQIRSQALADSRKPYTNAEFEQGVQGLRGIIAGREADVQNQVR